VRPAADMPAVHVVTQVVRPVADTAAAPAVDLAAAHAVDLAAAEPAAVVDLAAVVMPVAAVAMAAADTGN